MISDAARPLSVEDITAEIRHRLERQAPSVADNAPATGLDFARSQTPTAIDLKGLLALDGEEFLTAAYLLVLGRSIDPGGREIYLNALETGRSKFNVLVEIRYSEEGKAADKTIKGLRERYIISRIRQNLEFGKVIRLLIAPLRVPFRLLHLHKRVRFLEHKIAELQHHSLSPPLPARLDTIAPNQILPAALTDQQQAAFRRLQALDADFQDLEDRIDAVEAEQDADHSIDLFDDIAFDLADFLRGSRDEVKERLRVYLPFLNERGLSGADKAVLDLSAGRGEWLELLSDQGIIATGVETNRLMTEFCVTRGLHCIENDPITYAKELDDNSFDAVTAFQFLPQFKTSLFVTLCKEAIRIVKSGGTFIAEISHSAKSSEEWDSSSTPRSQKPYLIEFLGQILLHLGFVDVLILQLTPPHEMFSIDKNVRIEDKRELLALAQPYALIARKA